MAFKLTNPPYKIDNTPVYHVDMDCLLYTSDAADE